MTLVRTAYFLHVLQMHFLLFSLLYPFAWYIPSHIPSHSSSSHWILAKQFLSSAAGGANSFPLWLPAVDFPVSLGALPLPHVCAETLANYFSSNLCICYVSVESWLMEAISSVLFLSFESVLMIHNFMQHGVISSSKVSKGMEYSCWYYYFTIPIFSSLGILFIKILILHFFFSFLFL